MAAKHKELSSGEVSPKEVVQRMAILKRFRELLRAQRDRFGAYLDVLEKQKDVIERGTTDTLIRYVELEEKIVADIVSIQKVIDPLEVMYRSTHQSGPGVHNGFQTAASDTPSDVMSLKQALEGLKTEASSRSKQNRELLSKRMAGLRAEIKSLRSNPYNRPLTAFSDSGTPSLVDFRG